MTRDELHNALLLLLVGGLDTVTVSRGLAVEYLAAHPEVRRQIVDEPDLIPSAVEEFLRFFSIINIHREVVHDTVLGGVQLRKGDYVGACLPAANRDDMCFSDAGVHHYRRYGAAAPLRWRDGYRETPPDGSVKVVAPETVNFHSLGEAGRPGAPSARDGTVDDQTLPYSFTGRSRGMVSVPLELGTLGH
jgi:hypothetical protein